MPVKQRRTMLLLYEAIQDEGYRGGYDMVRQLCDRAGSMRIATGCSDVYVPLSFDPGSRRSTSTRATRR